MCLAIPGKIKKIDGQSAYFDFHGHEYCSDVSLVDNAKVGEWILIHDGRALSKISEKEAKENLDFIREHEAHNHSH